MIDETQALRRRLIRRCRREQILVLGLMACVGVIFLAMPAMRCLAAVALIPLTAAVLIDEWGVDQIKAAPTREALEMISTLTGRARRKRDARKGGIDR